MRILCVFGEHAYGDPSRGEGYEHANFVPALKSLGHEIALFDSFDRSGYSDFADLNQRLVERIVSSRPDIVLAVLMHYEVWTETLDLLRRASGAAVVHWGTDDSWKFDRFSRFIAPHVDLHVTTSAAAATEAERLRLSNVMLSQWGVPADRLHEPVEAAECRYGCSFVGAAYGKRRDFVEGLRKEGIDVACFGHGWPAGPVPSEHVTEIFRTSKVSLNFADSGLQWAGPRPYRSRQIKARTFEVPGAGGVLLTEPESTLDTYFEPGRELVTFEGKDDLVAKVRALLADDAERDRIAAAGHWRVRTEHTYERRFAAIFDRLEPLLGERSHRPVSLSADMLASFVAKHRRRSHVLQGLTLARGLVGRLPSGTRARRALRRLTFELSWRAVGEPTYGAGGLPGRAFYHES